MAKLPSFDNLPVDKQGPHGNAWGLWGDEDQLGTLNHLTSDVIRHAAQENILTGERISLNWSMTAPTRPAFGRKLLDLKLINKISITNKHAHDDEWSFNSQCSSQWDGFRHYAYQEEGLYYLGRRAEDFAASTEPNGIQHVARKGIAGRAILADWYSWAQSQNREIDAFGAYAIPWDEILQTLESQGIKPSDFRAGDILVVRSGYIAQYQSMSGARRDELHERYKTSKPENIGIQPCEAMLRFLWDTRISAVCGDARSFEVWPCTQLKWHLHEWLLAGWGMPIGELFDLEELAQICAAHDRYTFFLSSVPVNVPGAVASPPNALAFF